LLETIQDNLERLITGLKLAPLDLRGFSNRINARVESQARWQVVVALGTLSGLIDTVLVVVLAFYMLSMAIAWHGLINLLPSQIGIPLLPYG